LFLNLKFFCVCLFVLFPVCVFVCVCKSLPVDFFGFFVCLFCFILFW
jgi:hypothetical protein